MTNLIGKSVKRVEDKRFLTGKGSYVDDMVLPNMTWAVIVRSDVAHANIESINTDEVSRAPGFVAVFTGEDMQADGINGVPCGWQVDFKNGDTMKEPPHPSLAVGKVRYVGDAVAVVIAETREQAADAAELLVVGYEELPAVVDATKATADGAPQLFDDVPNNIPFDWELGDKEAADAGIEAADHVTTIEFRNQRLIPNAMEPRAAIGDYDDSREHYTLYTTSQNPHVIRLLMSAFVMGIPEHKVRVVSPDVGGGFGSKIFHYAEEVIVTWASRRLCRPVKWTAQRSESFITDAHGRDHTTKAEMGFDKEGRITALRVNTHANLGAYLSTFAPCVPTYLHGTLLQGVYTTPAIHVDLTAVFTNTVPVDALRGAGRPEATFLLERLLDQAALELGEDPADLRRKSLIPPFDGSDAEPGYETQVALVYDSGNYEAALDKALANVDYPALRKQQQEARKAGRYIGIGLSTYIEACGIAPSAVVGSLGARAGLFESATVRVQPTGKVSVFTGSHSHGQGHDTTFAQLVGDQLGIPMDDVEIVHGDTDQVPFGMGTYGSRSLAVGGTAITKSIDKIKEKGALIAAHLLEASADDLEYADGKWTVQGTDKSVGFGDVALTSYVPHNYPEGLEPGLEFSSFYDPVNFTFPFGAHIAVVEIDTETGVVKLVRYATCDDVGNVVNPMIVEGQVHGGVTHGIGQALLEGAIYDDDGQLVNGSFMDYAMPRADDLPRFETDRTVTPCPHNPLGAKGAGETGTIGSTPAIVNAAIDALWPLGVRHLEMPLTPQRVWQAIQSANGN
ncbi:MAG TPA: xanthine dehydrogenase family protein molybdopterin-binding subunit [Candidatus Latescibacteria bacterium]|nr:carbon monoxide dehydrogenase [Gemmatimonadaceae bacterium]MDP6019126.1 xanthine dehydrogenase family protein molybdopterin-binding subunit [Candidatus Latescibacterota bacterium]HJP31876.1 xanthine dehydrogenase family protein molybdopterin-binding subunit [Candidatus Latescibacterota bacterium]